jgi:Fe-S cluster assembly iron-binding protein IscA
MATTTVPEVTNPEVTKKAAPVSLTANAVAKVKDIMGQQTPVPAGLRIGVVGGGCSGFSYSMQFENAAGMMDKMTTSRPSKVQVSSSRTRT